MSIAELQLHQSLVMPGVTVELRHEDATGIPIHTGGYLGELGSGRHLKSLALGLEINPAGFGPEVISLDVFQIDEDRNIRDINRQQGEDGITRFHTLIEVEYAGPKRFKTNSENALMMAVYTGDGRVTVSVVTIIVQGWSRFYLATQTTRDLQVYRDAKGVVITPELIGKFCRWDDLENRIVDIYAGREADLPSLEEHKSVKYDGSDLQNEDDVRVIWSSIRRQISGGIRRDGKSVRFPWSQVATEQIADEENPEMVYPAVQFLKQGEVVTVGEFIRPQDRNTAFKFEGRNIKHQ